MPCLELFVMASQVTPQSDILFFLKVVKFPDLSLSQFSSEIPYFRVFKMGNDSNCYYFGLIEDTKPVRNKHFKHFLLLCKS